MWRKIKGSLVLITGLVVLLGNYLFMAPVKATTAVLQLENSNVLYGIGARTATSSGIELLLYYGSVSLIIVGIVMVILPKKEKENVNEKE